MRREKSVSCTEGMGFIGNGGVSEVLEPSLTDEESDRLAKSAKFIGDALKSLA